MPVLKRAQNHAHYLLDENPSRQTIGVRRRDGSWQYTRWLGFLSLDEARARGKPVKLLVEAISMDVLRYG